MMIKEFALTAAIISVSCFAFQSPVYASARIATYTGTIIEGYDLTGMFGAPDTDLSGQKYTVSFKFDKSYATFIETGINEDTVFGINSQNLNSIVGTITINGKYQSVFGNTGWWAHTNTNADDGDSFTYELYSDAFISQETRKSNYIDMIAHWPVYGAWASLDTNVSPTFINSYVGQFSFSTVDISTNDQLEFSEATMGGPGYYSIQDAIPEPATWALMIVGFGTIGGVIRRQRKAGTPFNLA